MDELTCFKAYDIRGEVDVNLNKEIVWRIGRAYGEWLQPRRVVVGGDIRLTSETYKQALMSGLMHSGADVIDLGATGTEEVYFATRALKADGGIQITASHNPAHYNGMKLVREDARPISNDNGLLEIKALAEQNSFCSTIQHGGWHKHAIRPAWVAHLLSYVSRPPQRALRIVVNAGHGAAGPALDALDDALREHGVDIEFIRIYHQPDGTFPAGVPNPMLVENQRATAEAVLAHGADFGVAWDGDFDRCFFFDERGKFIESYYLVGLFAAWFLQQSPGSAVLLDPRLIWNTLDTVQRHGGKAIVSRTGHAFIKARMREEDAVYGGEMSGHHYFRQFGYCDSGMIPLVVMLQMVGATAAPLSSYVQQAQRRYPASGEINLTVANPAAIVERLANHYRHGSHDRCDGLSVAFIDWRFNLRMSNTEPLIRLNVETRGDTALLAAKTSELLSLINKGT
nr:phosphomannomutase CpsG [uncultured Enterobacter sp.]